MINRLKEFIARLSGFFKTDLNYIITQGGVLSLAQFSGIIISFFLTIAFANLVSQETYGTYRYILSIYSLLAILTMPGVDTAVMQSVSRGFDSSLLRGTLTKLKWSSLGSLASIGLAIFNFIKGDTSLAIIFLIVSLALPLMETLIPYSSFLNAKKKFKLMALLDIAGQIFSLVSLVAAMYFTKNIIFIMVAYFVPYIIIRILSFHYVKKKMLKDERYDDKLTSYGRSVSIFQILSRIIGSVDQIVLFSFLGPAQLAIFSLAMAIPNRVANLFRPLGTLAFPNFARRKFSEVAQPLIRKTLLLSVFILVGSVTYFFLSPFIFKYIFPKYLISIQYSKILIFSTISAITYPFSSLIFAHKKMKEIYIIIISNLAVKILSLIIFVPLIGIWGGVISVLASSLTVIIFSLYFLKRGAENNEEINIYNE